MSARGADQGLVRKSRRLPALARMPAFPRSRTALIDGKRAVYPGQGPCRVGQVVRKVVDGGVMMFYHLTVLDAKGGELFVPVEKASAIGVRLLMKKSEIPELLARLKKSAKSADNWKQRANDNLKLFNSGSPFDLAEVVASLTGLRDSRPLKLGESGTLYKARRLLIFEISEVMGVTRAVAEGQVDQALQKGGLDKPRPVGLASLAGD
jgi:CarD family transcriptional regulator, regulator of rRNA transcription